MQAPEPEREPGRELVCNRGRSGGWFGGREAVKLLTDKQTQ